MAIGEYVPSATMQAAKETPLLRLQSAVKLLDNCQDHTASVASALAGEPAPSPVTANKEAPYRPGIFGGIEDMAEQIERIASSINADMARIQRHI